MHASLLSQQFAWGILFGVLILAAVMRREQLNNWPWYRYLPNLAFAGGAALLVAAILVFVVNGPIALGR